MIGKLLSLPFKIANIPHRMRNAKKTREAKSDQVRFA